MSKPDYKEFTMLAILEDQTEIVQFIFQHTGNINTKECFFNKYDVSVNLPTGKETMPSHKYNELQEEWRIEFLCLAIKMEEQEEVCEDTSEVEAEMEKMYTSLQAYNETEFHDRKIYEWRLVPLWIADILIRQGETVFRYMGNNWWGVKDILQTGILNHKMLAEIYEGIA